MAIILIFRVNGITCLLIYHTIGGGIAGYPILFPSLSEKSFVFSGIPFWLLQKQTCIVLKS